MTQIRIQSQLITFPTRFLPGHVLTEIEAAALEGLRAENIRNNVLLWDRDGVSQEELARRVQDYAGRYQFSPRSGAPARSEMDKELDAIVQERRPEARGEEALALRSHPEIVAEAERRVFSTAAVARRALQGLGLE